MKYPVVTSMQLRAVLRGMRKARGLSQARVGELLCVNQKRTARIEAAPERTSFGQISRLVALLGGRLVVEMPEPTVPSSQATKRTRAGRKTKVSKVAQDSW